MGDFSARKIGRKVKKLTSMLYRDLKIECCEEPTKNLFIGNAGLTTGLLRESLLTQCLNYGRVDDIVMIAGKSYSFVIFHDIDSCALAHNNLQAKSLNSHYQGVLYLAFVKSTPVIEKREWQTGPPGLCIVKDFVTEDEEMALLQCINWEKENSGQCLKHRRVLHFGYEFQYHNNSINKEIPLDRKLPNECDVLFSRLREKELISSNPDQLTVNQYLPGQGIPPHIDTHSACEDTILSLSLGSPVVMDFKHRDGRTVPLLLPQRSILIMRGEARYVWSHGITPRKMDVVPSSDGGLSVQKRGIRTSFTFRWTRDGECLCMYHSECDSYKKRNKEIDQSDENAALLENIHVHKVYEDIADHFSETRHKPWPNVLDFVHSFPKGSLLVDVGCGNGKYFGRNKEIYEIGCDTSWSLLQVCRERGHQVFTCNCLAVPVRDNTVDACISIAVIHHLANQTRRMKALQEMVRILRPGGRALIYVWAKNQEYGEKKSSYLKQNRLKQKFRVNEDVTSDSDLNSPEKREEHALETGRTSVKGNIPTVEADPQFSLPLHTNRTQFVHQDVLVPWKLKPQSQKILTEHVHTFYRYYHVFEKGELEEMCQNLIDSKVVKCFYDQGNWCIVIEKT